MALLAAAIALGAWLRFATIGAREMSADEGASWAAAAAPRLAGVVHLQAVLNPGKLAVYEILLHGWMKIFGDGLGAMRALSAMFDTMSIVVVFVLVRELIGARSSTPRIESLAFGGIPPEEAETVAALAALLLLARQGASVRRLGCARRRARPEGESARPRSVFARRAPSTINRV